MPRCPCRISLTYLNDSWSILPLLAVTLAASRKVQSRVRHFAGVSVFLHIRAPCLAPHSDDPHVVCAAHLRAARCLCVPTPRGVGRARAVDPRGLWDQPLAPLLVPFLPSLVVHMCVCAAAVEKPVGRCARACDQDGRRRGWRCGRRAWRARARDRSPKPAWRSWGHLAAALA